MNAATLKRHFAPRPVPGARLRTFEICFVLQFLAWMGMLYLSPFDWLGREGFHPDLRPLQMSYWKPWPKLPDWGVVAFGLALFGGAGMILRGGKWRRGGLLLALMCSIYVLYADATSSFSVSRLNVLVFAILFTAPPGWTDALGRNWVSPSPVWILRGLLVGLYFTAGLAKVFHGNWLEHGDVIASFLPGIYRTDLSALMLRTMPPGVWAVQKWLALGFELGAPLLFAIPKLRPLGIVAGLGFHLFIAVCFYSIWPFSLHCAAYYVLFIPESWMKWIADQWRQRIGQGTQVASTVTFTLHDKN